MNLKQFWMRRARRLLPALYLLLVTVSLVWFLFIRDEMYKLRGDVVAALTYVTNWYLVFSQQSYFEQAGRPSPLRHLWSLAVEEQFYLLWPVLLVVLLVAFRGKLNRVLGMIIIGALASTVLMAVLYEPGTDPSRVYYGTDTRAAGLLIGAALAFLAPPWRLTRNTGRYAGWVIDGIGLAMLAGHRLVLPQHQRVRRLPVPGRLRAAVDHHRGDDLRRRPPGVAPRAQGARHLVARVDRRALVRDLPVALAGVHGHPARPRRRRSPATRCSSSAWPSPWCWPSCRSASSRSRSATAPSASGRRSYRASRGEKRNRLVKKSALTGGIAVALTLIVVGGFAAARPSENPEGFQIPGADLTATSLAVVPTAPATAGVDRADHRRAPRPRPPRSIRRPPRWLPPTTVARAHHRPRPDDTAAALRRGDRHRRLGDARRQGRPRAADAGHLRRRRGEPPGEGRRRAGRRAQGPGAPSAAPSWCTSARTA